MPVFAKRFHQGHKALTKAIASVRDRLACRHENLHVFYIRSKVQDQSCIKAAVLCHATALKYANGFDAMLGLNAYRALYLPPGERRWAEAFAVTSPRDNRFL